MAFIIAEHIEFLGGFWNYCYVEIYKFCLTFLHSNFKSLCKTPIDFSYETRHSMCSGYRGIL